MAAASDSPVCPDWVFLNNCNVHVAKDRGWFKTYIPFTSTVNASPLMAPSQYLPVLGIGTVEIPTKRSPNLSGVSSHGSLRLHEVLHVPDVLCNIIGQSIGPSDGYALTLSCGSSTKSNGTIKDSQGKNMAYFDPKRPLFAIKVRSQPTGPRLGPHALQQGALYMLGCRWDPAEERKWQKFKIENDLTNATHGTESASGENPPYTAEEKVYLKENWGSEFHFLRQHGLHIHKEDDRADGRSILRTFMNEDASDDESEDDELQFLGHQADYNFTTEQLDWIEEHYGTSENFMVSYGLKFYDDDDLEEAKAIADVMMNDDD